MSDKKIKDNKAEVPASEKVMTKYDRKKLEREQAKAREQREKKIGMAVGVVIVLALVAFIAYFPIHRYLQQNEVCLTVNGEEVRRPEFDYYYNVALNNYVSQYGAYLSYFGLDINKDLSTQMYSENLSWKDYFESMAVDSIKESKALKAEADRAGFVYDAGSEIAELESSLKENAKNADMSENNYLKQLYGNYATLSRVKEYMAESLRGSNYYRQVADSKTPSAEEVQTYYNENKSDYDSVDYYLTSFMAQYGTDSTDEQIAKALAEAGDKASAADPEEEGELMENQKRTYVASVNRDWLFDEARKSGDSTVIEDAANEQYYALSFVDRYLDESATADLRVIMMTDGDGQAVLDEWKAGAATEDSFIELCAKYSVDDGAIADGGLFEGVGKNDVSSDLGDWIFAEERVGGDTVSIETEAGYTYVMYYVGQGEAEWKISIKNSLRNAAMDEYMAELTEKVSVTGNLNCLKITDAE